MTLDIVPCLVFWSGRISNVRLRTRQSKNRRSKFFYYVLYLGIIGLCWSCYNPKLSDLELMGSLMLIFGSSGILSQSSERL